MNLLLVDDDPDTRLIAKMALEKLGGHHVTAAEDAASALRLLEQMEPDAMLTDMMMPDMSGTELLREVRGLERMRQLPVVFLTARSDAETVDRLLALGAAGVIAKPFDPTRLPAELDRVLGQT